MTPRFALMVALAVMPDGRPQTQHAVMRASVLMERAGDGKVSPAMQRRLFRGMSRSQRTFAAIGVAMYAMARRQLGLLLLFVVVLGYLLTSGAASLIQHLG